MKRIFAVLAQVNALDRHPAFRSSSLDELVDVAETHLAARVTRFPSERGRIDAAANHAVLPNSSLWFCSYSTPLALRFPDNDHVRIQLQRRGAGATSVGRDQVAVTSRQACISSTGVEINFGPAFQQVVWRTSLPYLRLKLAGWMDMPFGEVLDVDGAVEMASPEAGLLASLIDCMVQTIDAIPGEAGARILAELEDAVVIAFIKASKLRQHRIFTHAPKPAAPWQVTRAEAYIEANWDRAITVDDLARETGASARSLFRTFKQSRGCGPLEYARQLRLDHARRMLNAADPATTVTEVALDCGFADLGHFSRAYLQGFGELPSATLRRARASQVRLN